MSPARPKSATLSPPEEYKAWPIFLDGGRRRIQQVIFDSLPGTAGGTFKGSINGGQTAVANFNINSGTNELHGSAFYYHQNETSNALNLSAMTQGLKKGRHREHNFGYSLGGPVYIPKLYNGRNRTFLFINFEKDHRDDLRFSGFVTLPTPAFNNGDFCRLFDPGDTGNPSSGSVIGKDALGRNVVFGQIYDPLSTREVNGAVIRDPWVGAILPKSRREPVARNVIEQAGLVAPDFDRMLRNKNRLATGPPYSDLHIIEVNGDRNNGDRHRLSGCHNHSYRKRNNNGASHSLPIPGAPASPWQEQITPGRMVRLSLNSTISPTILNRIAPGYDRARAAGRHRGSHGRRLLQQRAQQKLCLT